MAKKLLIKKERKTIVDDRLVLLSKFEKHLVDDAKDYSTQYGVIKKDDLKNDSVKVGKEEFTILNPSFIDNYKQIRRLAQIITLKDIGAIIANTGINKESIILDAGTGSGALACFLGVIAKKVVSYDIKDEHLAVARQNVNSLKLKNVQIKKGDIFDSKNVREKNIDVFILDVTEPWRGINTADKILKKGGFLVSYSPNINQVDLFVKSLSENFLYEKTVEIIEREWTVKGQVLRPQMKDFGHTAFLSFARKITK
ncbi:MAG: methyltransferase domain-containing protein [Nanoarchaeota archaeon]|nr:methyltransferase domain-containing protein [Nanoarchaeota archaeon]MBU1270236.1 methyltransferase domain-containing protein [Nanoarchaeota archaeon]MBU1604808.1 methyltransferase domain-containing protein [Nanoarchaeota archaeon]MBU2442834.1 methyltransferase domain-containing protein [Nanoarchaeota archaeon]